MRPLVLADNSAARVLRLLSDHRSAPGCVQNCGTWRKVARISYQSKVDGDTLVCVAHDAADSANHRQRDHRPAKASMIGIPDRPTQDGDRNHTLDELRHTTKSVRLLERVANPSRGTSSPSDVCLISIVRSYARRVRDEYGWLALTSARATACESPRLSVTMSLGLLHHSELKLDERPRKLVTS